MSSYKKSILIAIMVSFILLLVLPLGVMAEELDSPLVKNITMDRTVIEPKYDLNDVAITVEFQLERPAEVQLIGGGGYFTEFYHGPKTVLQPGLHQLTWHGMDNNGALSRFREGHFIVIRATEIVNGVKDPNTKFDYYYGVDMNIKEYLIPNWRMEDLIVNVELDKGELILTEKTVVNGKITVSEEVIVEVRVVNRAGAVAKYLEVKNLGAGIHSFSWDGTEFDGSDVYNGTYFIKIDITESRHTKGTKTIMDLPIVVKGGLEIPIAENPQMVRVIAPKTHLRVYPSGQYEAKAGDIFPIFDGWGAPGHDTYNVLVEGEIPAIVNVAHVELINLDDIPRVMGFPTKDGVVVRDVMVYIQDSAYEEIVNKNTPLRILKDEGEWFRVLTPTGRQLYIRKSEISFEEITSTEIIHKVTNGDTLWNISQRYGVTVQSIVSLNKLDIDRQLEIGKELLIKTDYIEEVIYEDNVYIVKSGDSLWKIAKSHGVSLEELMKANNIFKLSADFIVPGQRMTIPESKRAELSYTVLPGDSLWKIAQGFRVTVEEIVKRNNISNPNLIIPGQALVIPRNEAIIHRVVPGDSLWKIAKRYNKTVGSIAELNNIENINYIEVGQMLLIN